MTYAMIALLLIAFSATLLLWMAYRDAKNSQRAKVAVGEADPEDN